MNFEDPTLYRSLLLSLIFIFIAGESSKLFAQDDWVEYVTVKDKGVMAVSLDLNFDLNKPNYKNLVVIGGQFKKCLSNGFPSEDVLDEIYTFSDSASLSIDKLTPKRLVAFITYQCMAFDVFYVKDTMGLRSEMDRLISQNFKNMKTYVEIKRDKSYAYYNEYLYPRDFSSEFLIDQDYLHDLVLQGDDLKGLRKVEHWIYFKNIKKRNLFGKRAKELKFSLDSIAYRKKRAYPFELKISRKDSIDPISIYQLTSMLRTLSLATNGLYDGWSTEVKIKD